VTLSPTVDRFTHEHSLVRYQTAVLEILTRYRQPEPWWTDARCRGEGPGRWFPTPRRGRPAPAELQRFCAACPVYAECEEAGRGAYAGVWAGRFATRTARSPLGNVATRGPRPPQVALTG
jgi:hypothetical protein